MRMVGPNCMGLLHTDPDVRLNASFAPQMPPPGTVALGSQSGALGVAIIALARRLGLGLSTFVSVGNKADVSGNDLLRVLGRGPAHPGDPASTWSRFGNPRRFARIARRVGRAQAHRRGQERDAPAPAARRVVPHRGAPPRHGRRRAVPADRHAARRHAGGDVRRRAGWWSQPLPRGTPRRRRDQRRRPGHPVRRRLEAAGCGRAAVRRHQARCGSSCPTEASARQPGGHDRVGRPGAVPQGGGDLAGRPTPSTPWR